MPWLYGDSHESSSIVTLQRIAEIAHPSSGLALSGTSTKLILTYPVLQAALAGLGIECPTGLAPVVNRFDNYPRRTADSVGRARSGTSIVATPRPKLVTARLGLVKLADLLETHALGRVFCRMVCR